MKGFRSCFIPLLFGLTAFQDARELATVETTADAAAHGGKLDGQAEILTASGSNEAVLIRFRTSMIERWEIRKAVIAFHLPGDVKAPAQVLIAALKEPWKESDAVSPAMHTGEPVPAKALKDGWVTVEVPAKVCRELAFGKAYSVALSVPEGGRLAVHSRRTGQFMPYLLVRGQAPLLRPAQ